MCAPRVSRLTVFFLSVSLPLTLSFSASRPRFAAFPVSVPVSPVYCSSVFLSLLFSSTRLSAPPRAPLQPRYLPERVFFVFFFRETPPRRSFRSRIIIAVLSVPRLVVAATHAARSRCVYTGIQCASHRLTFGYHFCATKNLRIKVRLTGYHNLQAKSKEKKERSVVTAYRFRLSSSLAVASHISASRSLLFAR